MTDIDMEMLTSLVKQKINEQGLNINKVAISSGLEYNTVKDALKEGRVPKLDTLQKIARAIGYEFSELLLVDQNVIHLQADENFKFRKFRRLNDANQEVVHKLIDASLLQQEQDEIVAAKNKGKK